VHPFPVESVKVIVEPESQVGQEAELELVLERRPRYLRRRKLGDSDVGVLRDVELVVEQERNIESI